MSVVGMLVLGFIIQFGFWNAGAMPGQCGEARSEIKEWNRDCEETKQIWPIVEGEEK